MDPTISRSELASFSNLDTIALDVIGWNLATGSTNLASPIITSLGTVSFIENGLGTVYTAVASDSDPGSRLTFSLGGVDAAKFSINSSTGVVKFLSTPNFEAPTDSGGNNTYDITVTASDGLKVSSAKSVATGRSSSLST